MRQKSKAKGKRILGVVLALVFLISCIMTPDVHAQAESMIIALSARSVKIGDTLAVTVTLPAGVTGTVNLTYSKDLFTYQSATAETSVNAGTVSMTLGSYGSETNVQAELLNLKQMRRELQVLPHPHHLRAIRKGPCGCGRCKCICSC